MRLFVSTCCLLYRFVHTWQRHTTFEGNDVLMTQQLCKKRLMARLSQSNGCLCDIQLQGDPCSTDIMTHCSSGRRKVTGFEGKAYQIIEAKVQLRLGQANGRQTAPLGRQIVIEAPTKSR